MNDRTSVMSDRTQAPHHVQVHTTTQHYEAGVVPGPRYERAVVPPQFYESGGKTSSYTAERLPSASQILAVVVGLPVGGVLLLLGGLTLAGTLTGLAVAIPLFILFSPILVPATVVIGLAVAGFLTAGAFELTAMSSFSWILNCIRESQGPVQVNLAAAAKHQLADAAEYVGQKTKEVGQKTKEVGQDIQNKAQDAKEKSAKEAKDAKEIKRTTLIATTATD
ncbi:P24 oleosin [Vigna unguiculata]|uniref:Oleosin n=1 Tax=Vigna unguiculata TaxID=3917 RepID=A0A4D6NEL9_VIGUN|nr:P24 oleosin [Vigna unguiculata]QCE10347.1 Oleosin [Vigna unguiculata]